MNDDKAANERTDENERLLIPAFKRTPPDKGEQCVVCGQKSWTCEHYHANDEPEQIGLSEAYGETDAERNV